jgi:hypothetical protein
VAAPPARFVERPVVARRTPPPPPVSFAAQREALAANAGRPLASSEVERIRPAAAVRNPMVRTVAPAPRMDRPAMRNDRPTVITTTPSQPQPQRVEAVRPQPQRVEAPPAPARVDRPAAHEERQAVREERKEERKADKKAEKKEKKEKEDKK